MLKTLKSDPEAVAQAELATAERKMKAGKAVQDELVRLHAIALAKVLSFHAIRADAIHARAEEERRAAIVKARKEAKAERAAAFDQLIESRKQELARQEEAGNESGVRNLRVTIQELKQKREAALA